MSVLGTPMPGPRSTALRRSVGATLALAAMAVGTVGTAPAWAADLTPPAPVTGMKTSADKSRVKLDWTSSREPDLAGYRVYRSSSPDGDYHLLTPTPRRSSDYSDPAARAGLPSYYRVTAVDTSGNESAPIEATGIRKDGTAPAAVTGLTARRTDEGVVLDWTDGPEVDLAGYVVSRATSSGGSYTRLTPRPVTASTFLDTTAAAGTGYYYKVSAVDLGGYASSEVRVAALVPDLVAPVAVSGMKATSSTSGVKLDWSSNKESDLAGYHVYRASSADGDYLRLTVALRTSSDFTDKTALPGRTSYYRVTAVDRSGNESAPVAATGIRKDSGAPARVTALGGTRTADGVALDWADSPEGDLAGYVVSRSTSSGGSYVRLAAALVTGSAFTDTTAQADRSYWYRVTAVDTSGNTSSSATVAVAAPDLTAPLAVTGLKVSADSSRVKLDWSSGKESDLAGYHVYRAPSADGEYTRLTATPTTSSEYSDTTAPAGLVSHYRVTAIDEAGNESPAVSASGLRRDAVAPATVSALTAAETADGVVLDWADGGEADLAGYLVSRSASASGPFTALTPQPVTASTFTDAAPAAATAYYRVTAVDLSGNGSAAATVAVTPVDTTAPAQPAGLAATAGAGRVALTWRPVADGDLAGYHVHRWVEGAPPESAVRLTTAPVAAPAYADTTATEGERYVYAVSAVDVAGNESARSEAAHGTALDTTAPAAPTGLTATGTTLGVTLDWADGSEGDLAGYRVARATGDGTFVTLTETPLAASTFTDTTATAGVTSAYRVTAVDTTGNESAVATAEAVRLVEKAPVAGADLTVAQDGSGDYTTVAEAVAAAPADATAPFTIAIRPGTYREVLTVAKPHLTLVGATGDPRDVVITYDNAALTPKPDGSGTLGTSGSATVLVKANDVTVEHLTIENGYVETGASGEQAVALKTTGDRLVFRDVRLLGDQDTLYVDSPGAGALARSYFVQCYVEGDVDFVFGRGTAVLDRSTLHASTRGSGSNNGYVVAPSTDRSLPYGFLITDSTITSDAPAGTFHLGRPWQPSGDVNAVGQVVVRNTELPSAVKAAPWTDMGSSSWRSARFFEYANTGAGAAVTADRPQLTDLQAATVHKWAYLAGADGWNPTGETAPPPPADTTAPGAPTALAAEPGESNVALTWAASDADDLAGYRVYRSTDGTVATTVGNLLADDLVATPAYVDRTAANGTAYTYVVTAVDEAGNESAASGPVTATPVGVALPAHDVLVAADGTGQHTSVQAALNAAPAGTAAKPTVVAVKPGVYKEMVSVTKSHVTIVGTTGDAKDVVLTYDNAAGTPIPGATGTYGTSGSQSVLVKGSNVTVKDLTIENSFDEAAFTYSAEQAVALHTTGDRLVFDNVRVLGNQDTLLVNSPDANVVSRSYFVDSYIEGDVDFIFGRGTAVFQRTTIHALSRGSGSNNGYITGASTADKNPYGFLIVDSTITSNAPAGTFSLGRPWRGWSDGYTKNGVVYNSRGQVTVRDTELTAAIRTTQPWADMSPNLWTDGRFFEYRNTGAGATVNANRPQLGDEQAATATPQQYLAGTDGWDPTR